MARGAEPSPAEGTVARRRERFRCARHDRPCRHPSKSETETVTPSPPLFVRALLGRPDCAQRLTRSGFFFAFGFCVSIGRFAVGTLLAVSSVISDVPAAPLENDPRREEDLACRPPATLTTDGRRFRRAVHNLKLMPTSCASILVGRQLHITSAISEISGAETFAPTVSHYTALSALGQDRPTTLSSHCHAASRLVTSPSASASSSPSNNSRKRAPAGIS